MGEKAKIIMLFKKNKKTSGHVGSSDVWPAKPVQMNHQKGNNVVRKQFNKYVSLTWHLWNKVH